MAALRHILTVPLALLSFSAVFYSIGKLMVFLSAPSKIRLEYVWIVNLLDNWSRFEKALLPITVDTILIVLFILQHSLMRTSIVKAVWKKLGLETAERSIYNVATAATIVVSIKIGAFNALIVCNNLVLIFISVLIGEMAIDAIAHSMECEC